MTTPERSIAAPVFRLALKAALAVVMVLGVLQFSPAYAGCAPGLPCIVNATANDPANANDGPNSASGPNMSKATSAACTGNPPPPGCGCDADFMNQIYSRAWLEGQRELTKANILIRKPDSILEYTCFNQFANMVGTIAGPLFTDSMEWQSQTVDIGGEIAGTSIDSVRLNVYMGGDHLTNSINRTVLQALGGYIGNTSFNHRFLGGSAVTLDYTASSGGYNCNYMEQVHHLAKCSNIITDDRFWTFAELISPDPRVTPMSCPSGTQITQQRIDLANNHDLLYVGFDRVTPNIGLLHEPSSTPPDMSNCAPPIPTGLTVTYKVRTVDATGNVTASAPIEYADKTCPNPNCYYCARNDACYTQESQCPQP